MHGTTSRDQLCDWRSYLGSQAEGRGDCKEVWSEISDLLMWASSVQKHRMYTTGPIVLVPANVATEFRRRGMWKPRTT